MLKTVDVDGFKVPCAEDFRQQNDGRLTEFEKEQVQRVLDSVSSGFSKISKINNILGFYIVNERVAKAVCNILGKAGWSAWLTSGAHGEPKMEVRLPMKDV
jgi:hypothetical protein